MKFVEKHLTTHHLFRAPHKWFFAFLSSPIHFLEMQYKKKYHLTFRHAKKLFLFDVGLLLTVLLLAIASTVWYFYDPTVTKDIALFIEGPTERVRSGDNASYTISYTNNSDVSIVDGTLALSWPHGFQLDTTASDSRITPAHKSITFDTLAPGESEIITIKGRFFDVPKQINTLAAVLSYMQKGKQQEETIFAKAKTTLQDSVLQATLHTPETLVNNSQQAMSLVLHNSDGVLLSDIAVPLQFSNPEVLQLTNPQVSLGEVRDGVWHIDELSSQMYATTTATLVTSLPSGTRQVSDMLTPTISIDTIAIAQSPADLNVAVVSPDLQITTLLNTGDTAHLIPGNTYVLTANIQNAGTATLEDVVITLPTQGFFDLAKTKEGFAAQYRQEAIMLNQSFHAGLRSMAPGAQLRLEIPLSVKRFVTGTTAPNFTPQLSLHGRIAGVPGATYNTDHQSSPYAIAGSMQTWVQAKYYTAEGDQLGRGPLPPQVGRETRYWVLLHVQNGSNIMRNIRLSAPLAPGIRATGKSSVSMGNDVRAENGLLSWTTPRMGAQDIAGIFFEVAITPTAAQAGGTPPLLGTITVTAEDVMIDGHTVEATAPGVDMRLLGDELAQQRGVIVR